MGTVRNTRGVIVHAQGVGLGRENGFSVALPRFARPTVVFRHKGFAVARFPAKGSRALSEVFRFPKELLICCKA